MKILIIGGYGVFGGRLATLLSDIPDLQILVAGRNLRKATSFCAEFCGVAKVYPLQMDRSDIAVCIAHEKPDLVVDASGPFQAYGQDPYIVPKTCINAGVPYLDFADAADFVFGISQFDADAKRAGVFLLSGVSSFPVLTAAVLREMSKEMIVREAKGGIAPSPFAGIGLNVMRAVVSYAGGPVKLLRNGISYQARGLTESLRYTIAVPGHIPLRNIRFSLVDVPDLQVIPPAFPALSDIWMGAGPVPEILHRVLNILAKTRAMFRLPSFEWLSPLFYLVLNAMKFGEHRGGMFVDATGMSDGRGVAMSWHLLAEGDDGPFIPSMAIEILIRKMLKNIYPETGARAATHALELSDYYELFADREIFAGMRRHDDDAAPLYQRTLGSAFDSLPEQVKLLHAPTVKRVWKGKASVVRGRGMLAKLIAFIFGFPTAADDVKVTVTLTPKGEGEMWERNFGGQRFKSFQFAGTGKYDNLIVEKFGAVSIALALNIQGGELFLVPRNWNILGIPLPKFLLPSGDSFESEEGKMFRFNVSIKLPFVGLVVAYNGYLTPP